MLLMLAALMQLITTDQLQTELGGSQGARVIVEDAIGRWSLKHKQPSGKNGMKERVAIVFNTGPERCVLLKLRARAVGENPVYCYAQHSARLVRSFDDSD